MSETLPLFGPVTITTTEKETKIAFIQDKDTDARYVNVFLKGARKAQIAVIVDSNIRIPIEDILEEVPIEDLVEYVLERTMLTEIVRGDKKQTFEILDNLEYDQIKEWLKNAAKYRLHP